jgi:putative hydrolase of the HAD superfamily
MMMIRALLFDADGVVIVPWRFRRYLEREHGITPAMAHGFFRDAFGDCLAGKADLKQVLPPYLAQWRWKGSVDDFVAAWLETENAVDGRVVGLIRSLRQSGILCCLASSQERTRAEYMTTVMGFSGLFDRQFFSCHLGYVKPEQGYFKAIQGLLGMDGQDILFWDDSAANVEAARECGWNAETYADFEGFKKKLAVYLNGEIE